MSIETEQLASAKSTMLTIEEYVEQSTSERDELIDGEIVEMSHPLFPHGLIAFRAASIFDRWVRQYGGQFGMNDGIVLDDHNLRAPDAYLISAESFSEAPLRAGYWNVPLLVSVEVVSPNERWADIARKMAGFFAAGTVEYWLIEYELRQVRVFTSVDESQTGHIGQPIPTAALRSLDAQVDELFEGIDRSSRN